MRFIRVWTVIAVLGLALAAGCKEDPMVRARSAHAAERADDAEKALKEVLAQSPKDFEARRLMADIHRFRGEFEKTEEGLNSLWAEKGFDKATKDMPSEDRARRDLLENQFNDLYSKWSESIDPKKNAGKFEKVVHAGLKWNKRSPTLNRMLVEHFFAQAEAFEKGGAKTDAIAAYESALQLRAMPAQRKDAQAKADALRKASFVDSVNKSFDPLKAELVAAGQWSEDTKTITFVIEAEVNKRLKAKKDADMAKARKQAIPTIRTTIAQWIAKVSGQSAEVAAVTAVKMVSGDETLKRGKYTVTISMLFSDVIDGAFAAHEKARKAAEAAAKKDLAPAATEKLPPGTNSGSAEEPGATNGKKP